MDIIALLVVASPGIIAATASLSVHRQTRHKMEAISEIKDEVKNGHTIPMRQDMDSMADTLGLIREDIRGIRTDINDIRGELRTERSDRLDLENRFNRSRHNR